MFFLEILKDVGRKGFPGELSWFLFLKQTLAEFWGKRNSTKEGKSWNYVLRKIDVAGKGKKVSYSSWNPPCHGRFGWLLHEKGGSQIVFSWSTCCVVPPHHEDVTLNWEGRWKAKVDGWWFARGLPQGFGCWLGAGGCLLVNDEMMRMKVISMAMTLTMTMMLLMMMMVMDIWLVLLLARSARLSAAGC